MAAVLAFVLLLILAAPAGAATVSVERRNQCDYKSGGCYGYDAMRFVAAEGEANDLEVTRDGRTHTFRDAGAPVAPGAGCRAVDAHTVTCTTAEDGFALEIRAGDGDDRVHAPTAYRIEGGEGNDILHGRQTFGGAGNDRLSGEGGHDGGDGDDHIVGNGNAGPGDDVVDASAGSIGSTDLGPGVDVYIGSPWADDVVDGEAGDPSRDRIDAGGGQDGISYGHAASPVTVDLGASSQAPAHDDVTGFEKVVGTAFADFLTGDDGANELTGGLGNDVLTGLGGADRLDGGDGLDRLDAGAGDDGVQPGDGVDEVSLGEGDDAVYASADRFADRIDCGPGDDEGHASTGDLRAGCERLELRGPERMLGFPPIVKASRGRYRVVYGTCDYLPSCTGTSQLRARVRGRTIRLPDVRYAMPGGAQAPRSNAFRLPAAAARELRRTGRLRIHATTFPDPGPQAGVLPGEDRVVLRRSRSGRKR